MSQNTRYAVVDDEDDISILYSTGWVQELGTKQEFSANGVPFQSTLHRMSQNGSLSFGFHGSNIIVWGFNPGVLAEQAAWRCYIDGTEITPGTPMSAPTNNWYLCGDNGLLDHATGFHTLTIDVASISPNSSLWLDWIQYIPQPGYAFNASYGHSGSSMLVETSDPMIQFDDEWTIWGNSSNITWSISSEVTIDFIGTSLSWFGTFYNGDLGTKGQGSYSVDGLPDVTFTWNSQSENPPRQLFFEASNLSFGSHKAVVKYLGPTSQSSTPLIMDYLVIGNASVPHGLTSPSPTPPSTSAPSDATPDSGPRINIIIGGVIGGVVALVSLILLLVLKRKRRRKRPENRVVVPFPHNLIPQTRYLEMADPPETVHLIHKEPSSQVLNTHRQPFESLESHSQARDDTAEANEEALPAYSEIES